MQSDSLTQCVYISLTQCVYIPHCPCAFLGTGDTTVNETGRILHPSGESLEGKGHLQEVRLPSLNPLHVSRDVLMEATDTKEQRQ